MNAAKINKMNRLSYFLLCYLFVIINSYRLPTSVLPTNYKLQILSHLGGPNNFDFEGKVTIQLTCHEPTHNITLHASNLTILDDQVTVRDVSSSKPKSLKVKIVELDPANEFLIVSLEEQLQKDHNYELFVPFKAVLDDGLKGFYRSSYTDEKTKEKRWLGVTQFEAISARRAFPCFDEPGMKATFDITLGRRAHLNSISNMPLIESQPIKEKEGYFWDKYEPSVPMSTYLVAFMISDFGHKTSEPSQKNNVTFKIWAKKDSLDQVDYAREVGPKVLEYYEDFFDIKYPLPKQDMVAIPDFSAGAMENWGLITYREALLLFDPKVTSLTNQQRIANVIAHELAHQWFGNLVTMKWWTDLWLNEGFATYMASRATEHLYPEWKSFEDDAVNNILSVFSFDSLRTSHPVSVPIGHPNQIDEIFDTISYKKGSFLIRMMSLFLGDETLRKGVSNYLKKHKYANAEQDDLWESLTEEAHKNGALPKNLTVKTVMDTWTVQTGYPVIKVTRDYGKNTADVTQERFLKDEIRQKSESGCWWIPLTYTDAKERAFDSTKPKMWLSCDKNVTTIGNLPGKETWVLFNMKLSGLYKVNYDEHNWKMLTDTLNSANHHEIPLLNKVQLIDDSFDLGWTGNIKYNVVFDLLAYLKSEEAYLPWKTALTNINTLNRQLKKSVIYGDFKNYMKQLIHPIYEKIGGLNVPETKSGQLDAVKHQVLVDRWACKYDVANCVADATDLFRKYQKNPEDKHIISKEMRSVVFCTAIRNGGEKEWDFLWQQYKKSNLASEQSTILSALGCTRELWLLNRFLEWSITPNSGIRKQDSSSVFSAVAGNNVGYYVAKHFLNTRIKDIYNYLSQNGRRLSRYLTAIASQTTAESDYKELQNFVKDNQVYLKEIKHGVEQSLETAKLNVQWQHKHFEEIATLFKKYGQEKTV
ncbi:aminopeptidase N isoform X1 [Tribolium castaneum]|uniref:aminopeptidase N isoform X1 n=2 Tax=Tribolium castaneum TaxID=7070 RepID=UPI0030FE6E58